MAKGGRSGWLHEDRLLEGKARLACGIKLAENKAQAGLLGAEICQFNRIWVNISRVGYIQDTNHLPGRGTYFQPIGLNAGIQGGLG